MVDTVPRAECCSQSPSRDGALPQATPLERALGRIGLNFLPTALPMQWAYAGFFSIASNTPCLEICVHGNFDLGHRTRKNDLSSYLT